MEQIPSIHLNLSFAFRIYITVVTISVKDIRTAAQELEGASYKLRKHPS